MISSQKQSVSVCVCAHTTELSAAFCYLLALGVMNNEVNLNSKSICGVVTMGSQEVTWSVTCKIDDYSFSRPGIRVPSRFSPVGQKATTAEPPPSLQRIQQPFRGVEPHFVRTSEFREHVADLSLVFFLTLFPLYSCKMKSVLCLVNCFETWIHEADLNSTAFRRQRAADVGALYCRLESSSLEITGLFVGILLIPGWSQGKEALCGPL